MHFKQFPLRRGRKAPQRGESVRDEGRGTLKDEDATFRFWTFRRSPVIVSRRASSFVRVSLSLSRIHCLPPFYSLPPSSTTNPVARVPNWSLLYASVCYIIIIKKMQTWKGGRKWRDVNASEWRKGGRQSSRLARVNLESVFLLPGKKALGEVRWGWALDEGWGMRRRAFVLYDSSLEKKFSPKKKVTARVSLSARDSARAHHFWQLCPRLHRVVTVLTIDHCVTLCPGLIVACAWLKREWRLRTVNSRHCHIKRKFAQWKARAFTAFGFVCWVYSFLVLFSARALFEVTNVLNNGLPGDVWDSQNDF